MPALPAPFTPFNLEAIQLGLAQPAQLNDLGFIFNRGGIYFAVIPSG